MKVSVIWHHFTGAANFEIEAKQVSTKNNLGPFDILPGHANLIGIVTESISLTKTSGQTEFYFFTRGIIEVAQNNVKLFLEGKID